MTPDWLVPAAIAAGLWWFSTGVVLWLDRRSPSTFPVSVALATVAMLAAFACIATSSELTSADGAYAAFTSALVVWAWQELTFLVGYITGPRRTACPAGCSGGAHWRHAIEAIIYHELAITAGAVVLLVLTWGEANQLALATYGLLWIMRISAKLNLFLGVRNVGIEYLPAHLAYLGSFFRRRAGNWLLPVSVIGGAALTWWLLAGASSLPPGTATGRYLLGTLCALAVLEHCLLVLPLDMRPLWRWSLGSAELPPAPASKPAPLPRSA